MIIFRDSMFTSLREGFALLKNSEIFSLGLIDSMFNCSIQLFIFVWTPVLQKTAHIKHINVGMIFTLFIISILTQNKLLELFNIIFKRLNYRMMCLIYCGLFCSYFSIVYFVPNYTVRLIALCLVNVIYDSKVKIRAALDCSPRLFLT